MAMLYDVFYTDGSFDSNIYLPSAPIAGTRYAKNTNWDGHRYYAIDGAWVRSERGGPPPTERLEQNLESRIDNSIAEIVEAFWAEVAKRFPEITTGDLPPNVAVAFEKQVSTAVREWLLWNDFSRQL